MIFESPDRPRPPNDRGFFVYGPAACPAATFLRSSNRSYFPNFHRAQSKIDAFAHVTVCGALNTDHDVEMTANFGSTRAGDSLVPARDRERGCRQARRAQLI
jgi:hypothetical protein